MEKLFTISIGILMMLVGYTFLKKEFSPRTIKNRKNAEKVLGKLSTFLYWEWVHARAGLFYLVFGIIIIVTALVAM